MQTFFKNIDLFLLSITAIILLTKVVAVDVELPLSTTTTTAAVTTTTSTINSNNNLDDDINQNHGAHLPYYNTIQLNTIPKTRYVIVDEWRRNLENATAEISQQSPPSQSPSSSSSSPSAVEVHYLSRRYAIVAFTFTAIGLLLSIGSCVFIYRFRKHTIISVGQPPFLYLICFGAFLMSVSISLNAVDESNGRTQQSLNTGCITWLWMTTIGAIIVYMSLFCKLFRVEKVTRRGRIRQKILARHVIKPLIIVVLVAIAILIAWTITSPPYYKRETLTGLDGELHSIGTCFYDDGGIYEVMLTLVFVFCVSIAFWMSLKTRNVPEYISDSRRISQTLLGHLILVFIKCIFNVALIIYSASSTASAADISSLNAGVYVSTVFYEFVVAMISIGFLVIPKIYYVRYEQVHGELPKGVHKLGGRVTVQVNGIRLEQLDLPSHVMRSTQRSIIPVGEENNNNNNSPMGEDDNDDGRQDNLRMEMGSIPESSNSSNSSNNNISNIDAVEEK
jgi:hypothetical protein